MEQPKKNWKRYFGGFSTMQVIFIGLLFFYLIYSSRMTIPVPNYNNETNTVLYAVDSMVPPTYITSNHVLLGVALLAGLVLSFKKKEADIPSRADIKEAKKLMEDYLKSVSSIRTKTGKIIEIGDFDIDPNFITKYTIIKGERKATEYVMQINLETDDDFKTYVKGYVEPYTRYIDGFMEIDSPLESSDVCPECGEEFDSKIILPDEIRALKLLREGMKD